ncbi:protein ALP1-like [Pistacia vera]|uniref:protein ALP1-like n=1 Tax=Pistacia vera TaxID=55513 RepID=UPI001262DC8B|nr:protein ALP1-like [Pistacia vera]
MVCSFLHICAHHIKNKVLNRQLARSGETVSRNFHAVLNAVLRMHTILLKEPEPITEDSTDEHWKWFKNCLGALDGTHIRVQVPAHDKPRYRTRKNEIAMNVLAVCTPKMQFIYILPGWEGSAADGRVLRDAISRRNGLKVPQGFYYLCDAGYTNGNGFLAPYRGQRYHLNEWRDGYQPTTPQEFFNMKHSRARNCIERCFGLLKARWKILSEKSFYPIKTQCRIISACCLLHNYIRSEMAIDPMESEVGEMNNTPPEADPEPEFISHVEPSDAWIAWRDNLAHQMFESWQQS